MQGRLNEQAKRDAEWQGFEQFHDTSAPPPSQFVEIRNSNTSSNKEENLYDVSPHKKPHKIRTSQRKKSDVRIEMPNDTSPSPDKALKLSSTSAVKSTEEKAGPKAEARRFERVPIIRYEEDCRYSGKVVYKNFIPRTSDNYMRILKEVDWEQSVDKKRDIRNLHGIEFNSQFQSGNLNLAIEGVRALV